MNADHDPDQHGQKHDGDEDQGMAPHEKKMYLRFAAMILTGMVVMYCVMYVGSYEWGHVRWSESRLFMALTMGGSMGLVMIAWMLHMYKSVKANVAVIVVSALLLTGGIVLDRTQATVDDTSFMSAMIPHHSLAITRSERANMEDVRVCELAVEISEAQRREIDEMEWLIADIAENGVASTEEEAQSRAVPDFPADAVRECGS